MSHLISLKFPKSYICQIIRKERINSWHLDDKSGYMQFGPRTNIILLRKIFVKGFGIKRTKFGAVGQHPQIPDMSGIATE